MLLGIDHLVIAVHDPDAAAEAMASDLGLAVTGGGRHEHGGTHNRLAFLGDTYLELIGIFDRTLVRASASNAVGRAALRMLDEGLEGLATWALATDDIAGDVARLRAAGSDIGDPVQGSRRRPDGELVRWTCAFPELGTAEPPFLIEHEPAGAEWGAAARARRAAARHPVGGIVRLAALSIPVPDPGQAAARYRSVVGVEADAGGRARVGPSRITIGPESALPHPSVELVSDEDADPLDLVRFGIRWLRRPAPAGHDPGGG